MDLWIRDSSKQELVKCSRIKIEEGFETNQDCITRSYYTIYNFDGVHINWLGEYKTKERAMEVLDEIQKLVDQKVMCFVNSPCSLNLDDALKVKEYADTYGVIPSDRAMGEIKYISPNSVVFEMPKDKSE